MELNIGIIGYGLSGKVFHAPIIESLDGLNLAGIVTRNKKRTLEITNKYPRTQVFSSPEELFGDKKIDCIVISVPNEYHFKLAKLALEHKKHVILEKPMTTTYDEAKILIGLAKANNLVLTVYQNRRFDSDYLTIKKIISNSHLGDIKIFESHFDRYRPNVNKKWKEHPNPGTGSLYDLGSHLIDQCLDLFGLPEALYADLRIEREQAKTIDAFDLTLYYPNFRAILRSSSLTFKKGPRFIIHGTKGSIIKYGLDVQEEQLKKDNPFNNPKYGEEEPNMWGTLATIDYEKRVKSEKGDYRLFYKNFYNTITSDGALVVNPYEASLVIYIIEKAIESSSLNKRIEIKGQ